MNLYSRGRVLKIASFEGSGYFGWLISRFLYIASTTWWLYHKDPRHEPTRISWFMSQGFFVVSTAHLIFTRDFLLHTTTGAHLFEGELFHQKHRISRKDGTEKFHRIHRTFGNICYRKNSPDKWVSTQK